MIMEHDYRDIETFVARARQERNEALAHLISAGWQRCWQGLLHLHLRKAHTGVTKAPA